MKTFHGLFVLACLAGAASAQEDYATWGKSKPITINTSATGANIADTLHDFPLLVRLDSTHAEVFAQAKSGGADLRFRAFPGGPLAYRIDNWDSAARQAEIWVSVDRILPNNATQVIHMLWQKADAPAASNGAAVFDSAKGFVAAWHMGGAPGNRANSTPGGVPAVPATTAADSTFTGRSVRGVVGMADTLRGGTAAEGGEHFNVSPMPGFSTGFTFSFWAYVSSTASRPWMRFFDFGNGEASDNFFGGRQASTSDVIFDVFPSQSIIVTGGVATGQWKHYMMTVGALDLVNGMPSPTALYVDGAVAGTSEATFNDTPREASYLGRSNWADAYFTGTMDEVHVSKRARPAGWAKLSYETQKPGGNSVLSFGATGAPASIGRSASSGSSSAARVVRVVPQGRGQVFSLSAPAPADLRVAVLDVQGRTVWSSVLPRGATSLAWSGLGANGRAAPRGMYFVRVTSDANVGMARETRFVHAR